MSCQYDRYGAPSRIPARFTGTRTPHGESDRVSVDTPFFVDHWRARPLDWLTPGAQLVLALITGLGLLMGGVAVIEARHRAFRAEQTTCLAKLEAHYMRQPKLRAWRVPLADPCAELRAIAL